MAGVFPRDDYIELMKVRFLCGLLAGVGLATGFALRTAAATPPPTASAAPAENPYSAVITGRNAFGLVPIPVHDPAQDTPVDPPPKIVPNGIMTIFGRLQALFKVQVPAKGAVPAREISYTMSEGDRQDEILVMKIDEKAATITFDNHGVVQVLELAKAAGSAGVPGVPGAPGMPGGGMAIPGVAPAMGGAPSGATPIGSRFRNRNQPGQPGNAALPGANPGGAPNLIAGGAPTGNANNPQPAEQMSPEARVIMMEAQRAKWLDEGNPAAAIIPPTPLTPQVTGEGDASGAAPPPPAPPAPPRRR